MNTAEMIELNDILYGKIAFPQVVADLLNTKPLIRLSKIHQSGAIVLVNPTINHTRLQHSIGVMMLIKILGGGEKEQIAGLLHDISHTAFSHVGDYVLQQEEENYHEQIFEQVLLSSEIPALLEKYNYNVTDFLEHTFPILEQELPDLCADRLDYTLRDAVHARLISVSQARELLKNTVLLNGKISIADSEKSQWLQEVYERLNLEFFQHPLHRYANDKLALLFRRLMEEGKLEIADLMKNDTELLNKVRTSSGGLQALKDIAGRKNYDAYRQKKEGLLKFKKRFLRLG